MNGKKICGIPDRSINQTLKAAELNQLFLESVLTLVPLFLLFREKHSAESRFLIPRKPAGITHAIKLLRQSSTMYCAYAIKCQDRSFIAEYKARSIVLGKDIEVIQGTNSEKATAIDIGMKMAVL